ncbi:MAG: twin-arginine translocation signal domain-containing protein, partial [Alphaproteobacteria bacterium]
MSDNSRRTFLTGAAVVGAAAAGYAIGSGAGKKSEDAGPAAPSINKNETVELKMQAAWGGGIFLENAKS